MLYYLLCTTLIDSLIMCSFPFGERHIPAAYPVFTVHSELPYKACLRLSVDGNIAAPQQKYDWGPSTSLLQTSPVGCGSVVLVSTSIRDCGEG